MGPEKNAKQIPRAENRRFGMTTKVELFFI